MEASKLKHFGSIFDIIKKHYLLIVAILLFTYSI